MRTVWLVAIVFAFGCSSQREPDSSADDAGQKPETITSIRWDERKPDGTGTLYALTSTGKEHKLFTGALNHAFSVDKRALYYSVRHGKSGYEREGEALMRYDLDTGMSELVFEHDLMLLMFQEAKTKSGASVVVVEAYDGGRSAPEVVIADPLRGRVHVIEHARCIRIEDGTAQIAHYTDAQIDAAEGYNFPDPERTEELDLDTVLKNEATRGSPNLLSND